MNKISDINDYLDEVNHKLVKGGVFVGNFETVYLRHQLFLKRYPYYFAQLFYFIDFLSNRVFSKITITKPIYSGLSNGKAKILSLAEGLGRLYYNGFELLDLRIIENSMYL